MDRRPGHVLWTDSLLALLLVFVGVMGTAGADRRVDTDLPVDGWAYALVITAALSLAVRRVWPLATLAVVTLATSAYLVNGYPYGPILISLLVAVYAVARQVPMKRAAVACVVALVVLLIYVVAGRGEAHGLFDLVPGSAWVVLPLALGVMVRLHRESASRAQLERARRDVDEERLRVAREVHDVVGHGLSAINMQAEIALHLLPKHPEQAEAALSAISRSSREALDELRVTLGAVRGDGCVDTRAPLPGLARLDDLLGRMAEMGVLVRLETSGQRLRLPAVVDVAAYRVVQESLTNVLRHAGTATATVRIGYAVGAVTVEVTDTGTGAGTSPGAEPPSGHGLAGMRERVTALGGTLSSGPTASGGFRVYARLPLP